MKVRLHLARGERVGGPPEPLRTRLSLYLPIGAFRFSCGLASLLLHLHWGAAHLGLRQAHTAERPGAAHLFFKMYRFFIKSSLISRYGSVISMLVMAKS